MLIKGKCPDVCLFTSHKSCKVVCDNYKILFEFSLNVFTEFSKFSDKNICHYSKCARTCHTAISYVRDQDANTALARCM